MSEFSIGKLHHISTILVETGNSGYGDQVNKAIFEIITLQTRVEELESALWKCLAQSDELTDKQFRDKFKRLCGDLFRPKEQEGE